MTHPRIGALIPARLSSSRLPSKQLKDIVGRPAIHHLLDRVAACRHIADPCNAIVCTTEDPADDPLVAAVEAYGARVFRGDPRDLIHRFHSAVTAFGFDAVVRVDGDDVLCATEYMDRTMDRLLADPGLGIVTCKGLPLGTAASSFTRDALDTVFSRYVKPFNDTGFGYFFTHTGLCRHAVLGPASPDHILDDARLTMDYEEDLAVFRAIFEALYRDGAVFNLAEVVRFLRHNPEVARINAHLDDIYWQRSAVEVARASLHFIDDAGQRRRIET